MAVVKNKGISPLWELNSIFMNTLRKKLIVLTSNMASFSRSRIPRIWMLIIGQGNKLKRMENVLVHHLRCIKKRKQNKSPLEFQLTWLLSCRFVFSDRSLHSLIKNSLDPILESQKPSYVGKSLAWWNMKESMRYSFELRVTSLKIENCRED